MSTKLEYLSFDKRKHDSEKRSETMVIRAIKFAQILNRKRPCCILKIIKLKMDRKNKKTYLFKKNIL